MTAPKLNKRDAASTASALYDADFYRWTIEQAAALREGRTSALDIDHLAEEIEDLGKEQFSRARSSFRIILLHMLKWDHQPERRSRSWSGSITTHRIDLADTLGDNSSLRRRQPEAVSKASRWARVEAARQTGIRQSSFPTECPYPTDEILNREFPWPGQ